MAVLRKRKKGNYTVIDNGIFKNREMSLKAKGLLCLMLSLPDDWEYSLEGLATLSHDGKDSVRSALSELEKLNHFKRVQLNENGKFTGVEYIISEEPMSEKPMSENPISVNPTQLNTNNNKVLKESKTIAERNIIPPVIEWVAEYCKSRKNGIDAQQFMDHYESNGWMVGKNKMKDWQASIRTWERYRNSQKKQAVPIDSIADDEFMRIMSQHEGADEW